MTLVASEAIRLDAFLARHFPNHSRTKWAEAITDGRVQVDQDVVTKPGLKLAPGQTVEFQEPEESAPHDLTPADVALETIFEDDHLIVINKPRGLATHPAPSLKEPSLVNALLARQTHLSSVGGAFRPGIVHRLDKQTTGLIVVAKSDSVHANLAKQFESRQAGRIYVGIVAGEVTRDRFDIDAPILRDPKNRQKMAVGESGKPARTLAAVLARVDAGTLMAFKLETGRTHQIRVHMRAIGNPIIGDDVYAPRAFRDGPLQLHAAVLTLSHPVTGVAMSWFAPVPDDFLAPRHAVTQGEVSKAFSSTK